MQDVVDHQELYAVVMAGGQGERFWPAGRGALPKQLLPLFGERTMIEETVQRLFPMFAPDHILVMTNQSYVEKMRELLPIPGENIIGEPQGRDTAPCVALATALIARQNPEAIMVLLPADHAISPVRAFQETLTKAVVETESGALVTIGVMPSYPATSYGYIHLGNELDERIYSVVDFKEKPSQTLAEYFFKEGTYRWNCGIFAWHCNSIRAEFQKNAPFLSEKLEGWIAGKDWREDFGECPRISIDYAILERAEEVRMVEASFYWNDLGSWRALRSILSQDAEGNTIQGNVVMVETGNSLVLNDDAEMLLGVVGMHDVAIVKSKNAMLVCPLSQEERVRALVAKLKERGGEYQPWL